MSAACTTTIKDHPGLATLYVQSCSGGIYEDDRLDLTLSTARKARKRMSRRRPRLWFTPCRREAPASACASNARAGRISNICLTRRFSFPDRAADRRSPSGSAAMPSPWFRTRSSRHDPAGRDEMFSAYFSEIVIENETGKALAIDRLKVDGQAFRDSCPGISGSFAAQGTMIIAGLDFCVACGRRRASEDQARPR